MSVWDPKFRYTPSFETDISKRFKREQKRIEAEQKAKAEREAANAAEAAAKVEPIQHRRKA